MKKESSELEEKTEIGVLTGSLLAKLKGISNNTKLDS